MKKIKLINLLYTTICSVKKTVDIPRGGARLPPPPYFEIKLRPEGPEKKIGDYPPPPLPLCGITGVVWNP